MADHTKENSTQFLKLLAQTSGNPFLVDVDRAEGIYIWDKSGKRYIDMIAGVAVTNIGHRHPEVILAIQQQIEKHLHVMVYGEYIQDSQNLAANRLTALLPNSLNNVYFTNSGTEANEGAIKLAKRYTGRHKIVACHGSYHGSTHGSLSVTGNEHKKSGYHPFVPGTTFIPFNDKNVLNQITSETAAFIVETVQGDAGCRIPDDNYLHAVRNRCNETGTLLIFDEVQVGMGRTGKFFAFEHWNVVPDILVLGKALGGGMPIGAFVSDLKIMQVLTENPMLGHITTFGGHPVICAAAAACLDVLTRENWIEDSERKGQMLEDLLVHPQVREIRRIGLFFAIEMDSADTVQKVVTACMDKGLIGFWFLSTPESFRLSPPLSITDDELKEAAAIIREVFDRL